MVQDIEDTDVDFEPEEDLDIDAAIEEANAEYGAPEDRETPLILLADDDRQMLQMLREHFADQDCNLLESNDGAETLEKVLVYRPNLVLLDVMMPKLNGWEVCKYIRSKDQLENVGVIMLTGIGETSNELTSPLFGADDYIDKPFDFDELEFKIRKVISQKSGETASG